MNTSRHALYRILPDQSIYQLPGFDPYTYSRFKYGCVASTRHLAKLMVPLLQQQLGAVDRVVMMSSAFKKVPTAAALLLQELLSWLPHVPKTLVRVYRQDIFDFDFARLDAQARKEAMHSILYQVDHRLLSNQNVVVVDDAYVTGAHESKIRSLMANYPLTLRLFYIIDLSLAGYSPIESQLNRLHIQDVFDLLPLIEHPEYQFNSRALKFIFSSPPEIFSTFYSLLSSQKLDQLLAGACLEEYDKLQGNLAENYRRLQSIVKTI